MTLLHPPYTLWHLSYVAVGAALAPHMKWGLLGWTTLARFVSHVARFLTAIEIHPAARIGPGVDITTLRTVLDVLRR